MVSSICSLFLFIPCFDTIDPVIVRTITSKDWFDWRRMRQTLWPGCPPNQHTQEMKAILADCENQAVFGIPHPDGGLCGFLEASLRKYAEGCMTSPVGYIEGLYVDPDFQRRGAGRSLVQRAEDWARQKGCREMASDCLIDNPISLAAHLALGYQEVERAIHFRKLI